MEKERIINRLKEEFEIEEEKLKNIVELLDKGYPIPYLAHYGKDLIGDTDEWTIREIRDRKAELHELEDRKLAVMSAIDAQGKLTEELRKRIMDTYEKVELEDIFVPYKPKPHNQVAKAKEKGLEGLADKLFKQKDANTQLEDLAKPFIKRSTGVANIKEALSGAAHIVAERLAEDMEVREFIREHFFQEGLVVTSPVDSKSDVPSKYQDYYNFSEKISEIPSHRILAIRRGEKDGFLKISFKGSEKEILSFIMDKYLHDVDGQAKQFLQVIILDTYRKLIYPAIDLELRAALKERADREAIAVFTKNLHDILMTAPIKGKKVLGINSSSRNSYRLAAVDPDGIFLDYISIYLRADDKEIDKLKADIVDFIKKYDIEAVAIASGGSNRDMDQLMVDISEKEFSNKLDLYMINDTGLNIYASSKAARDEFPRLETTVRGAISVARRLIDPLREFVKMEARHVGVGQYQHDVDQNRLKHALDQVVESCVNRVGADVNTDSPYMLSYIAGLGISGGKEIVRSRIRFGSFKTLKQIYKIRKIGSKKGRFAAGFLRVKNGSNPLDALMIHPDHYQVVRRMAESSDLDTAELIANAEKLDSLDLQAFVGEKIGIETLQAIVEQLREPDKDPRSDKVRKKFTEEVRAIKDLREGMTLTGQVTNVTNFGVFVDIGVNQDGLVHVSELSRGFVEDPATMFHVGDVIQVKVISLDQQRRRIGLSIKDVQVPVPPEIRKAVKKKKKKKKKMPPKAKPVRVEPVAAAQKEPEKEPTEEEFLQRLEQLKKHFGRQL